MSSYLTWDLKQRLKGTKREKESVSVLSGGKEEIKQTPSRRTAVETLGPVSQPALVQQKSS